MDDLWHRPDPEPAHLRTVRSQERYELSVTTLELETPKGPARVHLLPVEGAWAWLAIGHGAGGGPQAPDIQAAARTANEAGVSVALVEQPYRVAGKKAPPRAPVLDEAWLSIVAQLPLGGLPLIAAGRSSGARVACRTADEAGAIGVLCLAFPLIAKESRQPELDAPGVPVLVIQGVNDRFGMPEPDPAQPREVVQVKGDHGLKSDMPALRAAVREWLESLRARI